MHRSVRHLAQSAPHRASLRRGPAHALQLLAAAAAWLVCLPTAPVRAFSQPSYYPRSAALGGGGGRWFTGGAADGYTCNVCHTGARTWPMQVQGLPSDGYVPGARYDVRIQWPEFSSRAAQLKAASPSSPALASDPTAPMQHAGPDMSMVAELSTSSGSAAGVLEMDYDDIASPERRDEWCEHLDGVPASQLFDTLSAAPDQPVVRCESGPAQRCLLAVQVCGARTLRFAWTAPSQSIGPVWFSAGMVATDRLSADPQNDDVTIVAYPIYPAATAGARYVEVITHGCSTNEVRSGSGIGVFVMLLVCVGLGARTRTNPKPYPRRKS